MIEKKYIYLFLFISFRLFAPEYLPKSAGEIIKHKYYTFSYNEDHEQANWVHYKLDPKFLKGTTPRINSFRPDPYVSTKSAELSDYKGSGAIFSTLIISITFKFNVLGIFFIVRYL